MDTIFQPENLSLTIESDRRKSKSTLSRSLQLIFDLLAPLVRASSKDYRLSTICISSITAGLIILQSTGFSDGDFKKSLVDFLVIFARHKYSLDYKRDNKTDLIQEMQ